MLTAKHSTAIPACLLLLLLTLSFSATEAFKPLSYHEKFQAAAHTIARTRVVSTLTADASESSRNTEMLDLQNTEMLDLAQEILSLDPDVVRQAVLDSVAGFSADPDSYRRAAGAAKESLQESGVQETVQDSETCLNDTAAIIVAMAQGEKWALTILDAMGKPVPGVTQGNLIWLGGYSLCQSIRSNTSATFNPDFSGQYCNAYTYVQAQVAGSFAQAVLGIGLCVPDTCSESDMTVLINDVLFRLGLKQGFGVLCPPHEEPLDTKAVVAIVICSVLLLCMVTGTVIDVVVVQMPQWRDEAPYQSANSHSNHDEHLPLITKTDKSSARIQQDLGVGVKVLLAFSVYTNGAKLLSTGQPAGSLTCVHGIRFISMTWVVLGHGFLQAQGMSVNFGPFFESSINHWTFQAITNALVSVDTFFVLSGLLVAYLTLKEMKKKRGKLNWFMFYFHRFWRLTPAYMLVIMVYVCLSPYWGEGPLWNKSNPDRDNCHDNWWTNLLYVNNLVEPNNMCLAQSWYLANDMQFYCILSPLVIIPLFYAPLWGVVVALCLVLAHCVSSATITMHNHFPPGLFAQVDATNINMQGWFSDYYIKPYTRWGPYVIGMLAGYFLYIKECKLNIKWYVNAAIWAVATGSAIAVLYGLYGASSGHPLTLPVSAFYTAMHRNVWGACISWLVIACVTGNGGFVNTLLSWPAFVPLSRLTYCIYLLHLMIMDLYVMNSPSLFYYSDINVVMFFLSVLVVSYMAAFIASLSFEAPMMALEKVVFPRNNSPDVTKRQQQNGHKGGQYQNQNGHDGGRYQDQNRHDKTYQNGHDKTNQNGHTHGREHKNGPDIIYQAHSNQNGGHQHNGNGHVMGKK